METLRKKKKDEKAKRKTEKKASAKEGGKKTFEDMIAYVDENGQITSKAPDLTQKKKQIDVDSIEISTPRKVAGEDEVEQVRTGKVAFFNTAKGYGFIKDPLNNESFFVHINDLQTPIKENDTVSFKAEPSQRGMKAVEVKVVTAESKAAAEAKTAAAAEAKAAAAAAAIPPVTPSEPDAEKA